MRLNALVQASGEGILMFDEEGQIELANPAACRLFGYRREELVGASLAGVLPDWRQSPHSEQVGLRKGGGRFACELTLSEVKRDESRASPIYVGIVRDISERKEVERLRSELISMVSHELRSPLSALSGALELMEQGLSPEQDEKMLSIARRNCEQMKHLVDDLLDLEKLEAGRLEFSVCVFALGPLLEDLVESYQLVAQKWGIGLRREWEPLEILADPVRIKQVLTNLLSNALKHAPEGSEVWLRVRSSGGKARIEVSDRGQGIPALMQQGVFERFSQIQGGGLRRASGTGLGLSIAKALVEHLGGQIGLESEVGHGSTFYCEFPIPSALEKHMYRSRG